MSGQQQYLLAETEEALAFGTGPIPVDPYYRDDCFALEREAIFKRTWLNIGHVCELPEPGSFILRQFDFANASILVTRDRDGTICAPANASVVSSLWRWCATCTPKHAPSLKPGSGAWIAVHSSTSTCSRKNYC
jgi:hypothetical protein